MAARALAWKVRLDPVLVEYRLTLPPGSARHLFAATVSLLPGTLSARLDDERLTVHVLDAGRPVEQTLARLEPRVATLLGAPGV